MKIPNISCKIKMVCPVNLSEDPEKVKHAISNIFPFSEIKIENFSIKAQSKELRSLEKIYETITSTQSHKSYTRNGAVPSPRAPARSRSIHLGRREPSRAVLAVLR